MRYNPYELNGDQRKRMVVADSKYIDARQELFDSYVDSVRGNSYSISDAEKLAFINDNVQNFNEYEAEQQNILDTPDGGGHVKSIGTQEGMSYSGRHHDDEYDYNEQFESGYDGSIYQGYDTYYNSDFDNLEYGGRYRRNDNNRMQDNCYEDASELVDEFYNNSKDNYYNMRNENNEDSEEENSMGW